MLKHRLTLLFVMVTLFVGASLPAAADGWHASVPFDFVVQGVNFPAGNYEILPTSSPKVVIVRNHINPKQSFLLVLPTGESLANSDARLLLTPKNPAPVKAALYSGQR